MNNQLWRVSVITSREAEEAISELLERSFGEPPFSYSQPESDKAIVSAFLQRLPRWQNAETAQWQQELNRLSSFGLNPGRAKLSFTKIRREDWAESWKRHFKPIEIGKSLLIRPSWSRRKTRRGQTVVELDPGLSFGTGQHPTTAFCLRQIVAENNNRRKGESPSLLDLGTGSGILAIAAAKLGYTPIVAVDLDGTAVRIARANARANQAATQIRFLNQDLTTVSARGRFRYTFVCANLTADVLDQNRDRILTCLQPRGRLVLSGILDREFDGVRSRYEAAGLQLLRSSREKGWRSGTFEGPRS